MAKRDKLNKQQKRQIKIKQQQRLSEASDRENLSAIKKGLVISRFGEQLDVYDLETAVKKPPDAHQPKIYRCYLRQNLSAIVVGDQVSFTLDDNLQGIVIAVDERTSLLQRPSQYQGLKPLVANIDQIFVVVAPRPNFSAVLLDRYLVAIENANIKAIVVLNKCELTQAINEQAINQQLSIYRQVGYSCLNISVKNSQGIQQLKNTAQGHRNILVGQSGVGKSSIINAIFPDAESQVNSISADSLLGQHTTTWSKLFLFENNQGFIIDSPGIREFALGHLQQTEIAQGFVEFQQFNGLCKFRDCKHINEPGCAVIAAVEEQKISQQRWNNYKKILNNEM